MIPLSCLKVDVAKLDTIDSRTAKSVDQFIQILLSHTAVQIVVEMGIR